MKNVKLTYCRITEDGSGIKVRVGGRALITLKCELMG